MAPSGSWVQCGAGPGQGSNVTLSPGAALQLLGSKCATGTALASMVTQTGAPVSWPATCAPQVLVATAVPPSSRGAKQTSEVPPRPEGVNRSKAKVPASGTEGSVAVA